MSRTFAHRPEEFSNGSAYTSRVNAVRRLLRPLRAHPVLSSAVGVAIVAVGGYVAWQVGDLVDPEYAEVTFAAPTAGTYHVSLRAYSTFSGVTLTPSYTP